MGDLIFMRKGLLKISLLCALLVSCSSKPITKEKAYKMIDASNEKFQELTSFIMERSYSFSDDGFYGPTVTKSNVLDYYELDLNNFYYHYSGQADNGVGYEIIYTYDNNSLYKFTTFTGNKRYSIHELTEGLDAFKKQFLEDGGFYELSSNGKNIGITDFGHAAGYVSKEDLASFKTEYTSSNNDDLNIKCFLKTNNGGADKDVSIDATLIYSYKKSIVNSFDEKIVLRKDDKELSIKSTSKLIIKTVEHINPNKDEYTLVEDAETFESF